MKERLKLKKEFKILNEHTDKMIFLVFTAVIFYNLIQQKRKEE